MKQENKFEIKKKYCFVINLLRQYSVALRSVVNWTLMPHAA